MTVAEVALSAPSALASSWKSPQGEGSATSLDALRSGAAGASP